MLCFVTDKNNLIIYAISLLHQSLANVEAAEGEAAPAVVAD